MTTPFALFDELRDLYLRYLDSPFALRYPELSEERRALLDRDGRIYRHPLIEPVTQYLRTDNFENVISPLLAGSVSAERLSEIVEFVSLGLFSSDWRMFVHQQQVLQACLLDGHDVVVTTGTGSGKTECFLLPIVIALLLESATWAAPGPRDPKWDWWNPRETAAGRRWPPVVGQRAHEARPSAMRAMILYPMNALVEDQLGRLRASLDSAAARQWLNDNRSGNRFYFGRYTGWTPVAGQPHAASKLRKLRDQLQQMEEDAQVVEGTDAERFFTRLDGAEMYSRWDMQDTPPDILITNYSMLNIMLMRDIEATAFASTEAWLRANPDNTFYLIVDELHSYRGTPGTEVAYLLRVFLDRIGLAPDSDQLRIISSSASLEESEAGRQYLEHFFARAAGRFRVIAGEVETPTPGAIERVREHIGAFRDLGIGLRAEADDGHAAVISNFLEAIGVEVAPEVPPARALGTALDHAAAVDALRVACASEDGRARPRLAPGLAHALFGDVAEADATAALEGVVSGLATARDEDGNALTQLRVHLFFRNLQGLWVCTNPNCTEVTRDVPAPCGRIYERPTFTCPCGSRVLELLYCEACGEIFFGGFRRDTANPNEWFLSPDHPSLETTADQAAFLRDYDSFAVYWPAPAGVAPASARWVVDGVRREWLRATLTPYTGIAALGGNNGYLFTLEICTVAPHQTLKAHGEPTPHVALVVMQTGAGHRSDLPFAHNAPAFKRLLKYWSTVCCAT